MEGTSLLFLTLFLISLGALVIKIVKGSGASKELEILKESQKNWSQEQQEKEERIKTLQETNLEKEKIISRQEVRLEQLQKEKEELAEQKLKEIEELNSKLTTQFENLANKIFEQKSQNFKKESSSQISEILNPLKERIVEFQKKVEETHSSDIKDRTELKTVMKHMFEINEKMSQETNNLTKALKGDVKVQGNWGEIVLERILESSGLRQGEEFIKQGKDLSLVDESGKRQMPDIIVNLPDEKHIVIDSKVSLIHYEAIVSSMSETDGEKQSEASKLFLNSVKSHLDGLSGKKYHLNEKLSSPEFTLMFFPIEGAYSLALQLDPDLFQKSWEKSIVIVGPTTLLATLKTVASIWKQEKQNKHVLQIADESGKLYDKMVLFIEDLQKIGDSISKSQETYAQAFNKLKDGRGNIISRFEKLKKLGANAKKQLPGDLSQISNED
ncbi:MAG: DNA recombination protein RmuC [Bacteriovoracaceae bacterium]